MNIDIKNIKWSPKGIIIRILGFKLTVGCNRIAAILPDGNLKNELLLWIGTLK